MAANSYYNPHSHAEQQQHQHLLSPAMSSPGYPSAPSSGQSSPLKPLHLVGHQQQHYSPGIDDFGEIKVAQDEDARLKQRIRRLRVVSRVLAFLISVAVFVPITLTLHKFISTKDVFREVTKPDGTTTLRTAWAKDSKVWPTWMYFLIAGISLLLNFLIIFSYKFGVKQANRAAYVATTFTWLVMIGNLVVWCVAASLYRTEKDKDGKSNDLWGWTCSAAARAIQKEFVNEVDFDRFCNVQSISWYIGLVQVAAAALTVFIYVLVIMRRKSKKNLRNKARMSGFEPARH